ncbi:Sulfate transporter [Lamellibrachia satsuma]|nr:Sulfate transporter [Lamellibrachia satsuma]
MRSCLLTRTERDRETSQSDTMVEIKRKVYSQEEFNNTFHYNPEKHNSLRDHLKSHCSCSGGCVMKSIRSHLPVIDTLLTYKWKKWLVSDVVAGLSVGIIHIPQGMGFSILASLPPVYGLYSSFFPVLMYFFLGTSRHISFGTMAVISLLIATVVDRESARLGLDDTLTDTNTTDPLLSDNKPDAVTIKVGIACAVSLLVGVIQTLMGVFKLGVVASFMSMSFVGGFLMGAGFHIAMSQLPFLLGLQIRKVGATGKIPIVFIEILCRLPEVKPAEVITSLLCITFLTIIKEVINVRYRKYLLIPVPAEMIVVSIGIFVSYVAKLEDNFGVAIIGTIPQGIPMPEVPHMSNAHTYIVDALIIAITSFIISVSMAKQFAKTHGYEIDVNQEFVAYGISHTIGSFLHCFAGAQAPPRSLVHNATGGKTQLASLFSCGLVLMACTVMAPLFELLPKCVVASVVLVALFPLFRAFTDLKLFWAVNRYDFVVWLVTWAVVVFVDVTSGLITGTGLGMLTVIIQSKLAKGYLLASTDESANSGLYPPSTLYKSLQHIPGIRVFHFPNFLYFANIENFKQQLFKVTVNPHKVSKLIIKIVPKDLSHVNSGLQQESPQTVDSNDISEEQKVANTNISEEKTMHSTLPKVTSVSSICRSFSLQNIYQSSKDLGDDVRSMPYIEIMWGNDRIAQKLIIHKTEAGCSLGATDGAQSDHCTVRSAECDNDIDIKCIIIDCSAMAYIDTAGMCLLKQLRADYEDVGINFVLASCSKGLSTKLHSTGLIPGQSKVIKVYPTIHDAVVSNNVIENPAMIQNC